MGGLPVRPAPGRRGGRRPGDAHLDRWAKDVQAETGVDAATAKIVVENGTVQVRYVSDSIVQDEQKLADTFIAARQITGPIDVKGIVDNLLPAALFSAQTRQMLTAIADVGVAMLMFAIGLEFEPEASRGSGRAVSGLVVGSLALPLAAGCGLGLLWSHSAPSSAAGGLAGGSAAARTAFVLFLGVAMSVTAFPVLVRILEDRDLIRTPTGRLAITSAALCDVIVWCLLGL